MRRLSKSFRFFLWPVVLFISAVFSLSVLWGGEADAVSGCCSRHHGVCDCQCCDGTPLSDTCRSRMPDCGGTQNAPGRLKKTSLPGTFVAWVIHVKDGDTIAVEYKKQKISIRLADIDCPEFKQPFGIEALEFTERQVLNQNVEIHVRAIDRYGRAVADVRMSSGESLNTALIKAGLAWWYKNYSKDRQIEALEIKARNAKRGLWSQPDPLPPWVYRRQNRVDKT